MRILIVVFMILVFASAVTAQQSYVAVDDQEGMNTPIDVPSPTFSTKTLTVQKVAQPEPLTVSEETAVKQYLKRHRDKSSQANRESLRAALTFLLGINQSHLPLNRLPNDYLADYQLYTQSMKYTDFYVRIPDLPAFTGGGSQGPLVLDEIPPVEQARCVAPCASPGAVAISHSGDRHETPIASAWKSWTKIPQQPTCNPVPKPETCDPNGSPPSKPPTSAPIGDPSGLNPGGPPAPNGPPPPSGNQGPVVIGVPPVAWDPSPTHPSVADPVTH